MLIYNVGFMICKKSSLARLRFRCELISDAWKVVHRFTSFLFYLLLSV